VTKHHYPTHLIEQLQEPSETAHQLGVSTGTLAVWRATKRYDLSYVKVGRKVMYQPSMVQDFINRNIMEDLGLGKYCGTRAIHIFGI